MGERDINAYLGEHWVHIINVSFRKTVQHIKLQYHLQRLVAYVPETLNGGLYSISIQFDPH